jgi:RNA polymerase sigma factor (sigma-70 family)
VADGEEPAGPGRFEPFFREHFATVARAMMLVVRDAGLGEDIAQESFARAYAKWGSMQSKEHASRFVYKVGLNLARSHHRRRRRLERLIGARGGELIAQGVEGAAPPDAPTEVFDVLDRLSPRQRACLVLIDYAGMSDVEAGRALGIRPSTVRVHLARGRAAMRRLLTDPIPDVERP